MPNPALQPITGSYAASDCQFLLTPLAPDYVSVAAIEQLIQSGAKHYSELISFEAPPSPAYLELYERLTAKYRRRLAAEVLALAHFIATHLPQPITVVSLARAGTPIGALLQRALTQVLRVASAHFSISIIRDRGIDTVALAYLLRTLHRPAVGLLFLDAWTAKGVITQTLRTAVQAWNAQQPEQLDPRLYVLADVGGVADFAATVDDYALPSGILNATVSGLVSRSILNEQVLPGQFHGCVVYEHLRALDRSNTFLATVSAEFDQAPAPWPTQERNARRLHCHTWLAQAQQHYAVNHINHIKPGIAEATRVLLRRVPGQLLLRDPAQEDVQHLRLLAAEKDVAVRIVPDLPFAAVSIIKTLE